MNRKPFLFPGLALFATALGILPVQAGDRWIQYMNYTHITSLADAGRHLWMATRQGLIRLDKGSGEKTYFNAANSNLPFSDFSALVSDGRERLWAISGNGTLAEFNGIAWSNLTAQSPLSSQRVLDLAWDRRGSLWILTLDSGTRDAAREISFFRRKDERLLRVYLDSAPPNLGSFGVYNPGTASVQMDESGQAWVYVRAGHFRKLYRIQPDGEAEAVPIPESLNPLAYIVPKSGKPFWVNGRGISRPAAEGWKTQPFPDGLTFRFSGFYGGFDLHPRHLYVQADDGSEYWSLQRLIRLRGDTWEELTIPDDTLRSKPLFLATAAGEGAASGEDRLWAAGGDRLGFLTDGAWSFRQVGRKPLGDVPLGHLHPRPRNSREILLAGTSRLAVFDPVAGRLSAPFDLGVEWGSSSIFGLDEDDQGRVWIKGSAALACLAPGGNRIFTGKNSTWKGASPYTNVMAGQFMTVDTQGTIWTVDSDKLISMPRGTEDAGAWNSHTVPGPKGGAAMPLGISRHKDGSLWIAAREGLGISSYNSQHFLARYTGKAWTFYDSTHHPWIGLPLYSDFRCDSAGNVWVITPKGLLQWDGSTWMEHSTAQSPDLRSIPRAMTVDPAGRPWIVTGSPEPNLLRWDKGTWLPVAEFRERFSHIYVFRMAFDATGRLWMNTGNHGLVVYDSAGTPATMRPGRPDGAAAPSIALRRSTDGSWRILPGELAGEDALRLRVLDLMGREAPGGGAVLRRAFGEAWIWPGAPPSLAPGNYLLSLQGRNGPRKVLPFRHALP